MTDWDGRVLKKADPDVAAELMTLAEEDTEKRWRLYEQLSQMSPNGAAKKSKE